ncbi:MAG: hypothetical protein ACLR93_09525 [Alistipes onderdonkii]
MTGYLDDAQAWAEIYGWIDAAKVACGMRRNRMGLLGNYYGGMVDVYSDLRLQSTVFGTMPKSWRCANCTNCAAR